MFQIDGNRWDLFNCEISRTSEMKASDISGMLLNRAWFYDVLGTYLRYDVTIKAPYHAQRDYAAIYELLTSPVPTHDFVLPYNEGEINIQGRVENVKDRLILRRSSFHYWAELSFSIISVNPTKVQTLEEAIAYGGASVLPDAQTVAVDDMYEYTSEGWEPVTIDDGDTKRY